MATLVLAAAGTALGASAGGTVMGLSMATIGRAAGATLGRVIDQRLLGAGSDPVETGRVDRFRLTTANEGTAVGQVFGRMRVPGQVIWATRFQESSETTSGGKGTSGPSVTEFSYTVSLAIALCEGVVSGVGRVWADGVEVAPDTLNMRVYSGSADQEPDPKIAAVEGAGNTPAYRGIAYVVMEDLALGQFGNRVPQFSFEVMRPDESSAPVVADMSTQVEAVALIPGTGEYSLSTKPAYLEAEVGEVQALNVNSISGLTDFETSLNSLQAELPKVKSGLVVVSWFGTDLRCNECEISPRVEQSDTDATDTPWTVAGLTRGTAQLVPFDDGRPVYGGTPSDDSVIEAIQSMKARGIAPVFYPFILMEQLQGNDLPDPYTGQDGQPALPWRGRITSSLATGIDGSPDQTAAAKVEVDAFMGTAQPSDFASVDGQVVYSGPTEWRYRRFILHYAHLCAAAGGVDAFCIGSEMRGMTQVRDETGFPFVDGLKDLAAEVRAILGPDCKISYAADWSEYHGYQPVGTADKLFHLDPLWADPNIDFIGIDNYMPLSDWRDAEDHADAHWESIYNLDYLKANVAGGEGYDWFYHSQTARDAQIRTPITDGDGEPWVWRYKDLKGWWSNLHHNRIDGVRQASPTDWEPESKPFYFTEYGCAAIDKGTNQPNKFLDPKSSESQLPYYSNGRRDDFMQMQYLKAMRAHFDDEDNNPTSTQYDGQMVDMSRAHAWAWDARPFPQFPANSALWSDGDNYARGHWLNGRATARPLASVVSEICTKAGVTPIDVSQLYGVVRGFHLSDLTTGRAALQPLMLAYAVEAVERDGVLVFSNRSGADLVQINQDDLAYDPELGGNAEVQLGAPVELSGRVQATYIASEGDYSAQVAEVVHPDETAFAVSRTELPLALTNGEGQDIVERWTHEARAARDTASFALPPSSLAVGVGDAVELDTGVVKGTYRIDRIEDHGLRKVEATRIAKAIYNPPPRPDELPRQNLLTAPTPVTLLALDLPSLDGEDGLQMPYLVATSRPWPGSVAVHGSQDGNGFTLQTILRQRSSFGTLQSDLQSGPVGRWDRQTGPVVRMIQGDLQTITPSQLLEGGNLLAVGDGSATNWEIIQFQEAEPLGDRQFQLRGLLRGLGGTSASMPNLWPEGSFVVPLNNLQDRLTVPNLTRDTRRILRYGPAKRPFDDPSYKQAELTFDGVSLRPYPVCHLKAERKNDDVHVSWIRQTRSGGDSWAENEIPLAEESERYVVEVREGGNILRKEETDSAEWVYTKSDQILDGALAFKVCIAQISARYGAGPLTSIELPN